MTGINFSSARSTSNFEKTISTLVFAGILIVCSVAVGCSSEKPATPTSTIQPPMAQPLTPVATTTASTPATEAPVKPAHKKGVRKVPTTVMYADESTGISFRYPRKNGLNTGGDADKLISSATLPMNFVRPGGIAVAAVTVPESAYPKSDLASAFFNVSVNKVLTAEQCREFSGSQAKPATVEAAATTATPASSPRPMPKAMIGDIDLQSPERLA